MYKNSFSFIELQYKISQSKYGKNVDHGFLWVMKH